MYYWHFQHRCICWIIRLTRQRLLDLLQSLFLFWTLLFESFGRWAGIAHPREEYCLQNQSSILDIMPPFPLPYKGCLDMPLTVVASQPEYGRVMAFPSLVQACAPLRQWPLCHTSPRQPSLSLIWSGHCSHHSPTVQAGRQGSTPGASAPGPPRHSWGWLLGPAAGWAHSACCFRQWSWLPDVSAIFMWPPCCLQPARLGHRGLEDDTAGATWYFGLARFLESHLYALGAVAVRQAPPCCTQPSPQWAPPPSRRLFVSNCQLAAGLSGPGQPLVSAKIGPSPSCL